MQWYVAEQIEEEALARTILDKLNMIGNDKGGLYLFDRDMESLDICLQQQPILDEGLDFIVEKKIHSTLQN